MDPVSESESELGAGLILMNKSSTVSGEYVNIWGVARGGARCSSTPFDRTLPILFIPFLSNCKT